MKYKQLTPFNFDMYLPILLFFQCVDVDNKSKIHIYHLKKKSITSLIHLSRQDTHSTNFHRFLSGWIGPFDRILPVFLFTQMHNGPCWNKNFAHKECWPYIYNLIKNSKMRYYHISFLEFSLVGLEFLKIFFFCTFLGEKISCHGGILLSVNCRKSFSISIFCRITQITPKRSLKIAIRSHAATQLVCAIAKYRNALGRFIQCTQQAEIRRKMYNFWEAKLSAITMGLLRLTGNSIMCNHVIYADLYSIIITLFCPMCYHPVVTVYLSYPPWF